ncbi:pentatricopeptide repeat-containing protein [Striga asiatica]|uniref:Pentatricopeptide repeat-containing protein n=1 Tax=Striga asiatica TaxID=4170 RepID=A0A5A7Q9F3_STRAF|nr:pentatricopeptide repeat-containing protein [Striga asiatica]
MSTTIYQLTETLNSISGLKIWSLSHLNEIHGLLTTSGLSRTDPYAGKILSFAATVDIRYAHRFFLHLPNPTRFHYNALIRGFSNSTNPAKSLLLFAQMLLTGVHPDHMTYPFLAKASARLSDPKLGGCLHARVLSTGFSPDVFISNSLIHMYGSCRQIRSACKVFDEMPLKNSVSWNSLLDGYAKCGDVASMTKVFDIMPERNVVSWSALIDGHVKNGAHAKALELFEKMADEGPDANEVTMVSALRACSHLGASEQGRAMHRYIIDKRLPLTLILRTSLVDMYAKCGAVDEALAVFREVAAEKTDLLMWNAVIGGLAAHGFTKKALEMYGEMKSLGMRGDEITYLCLLTACAHGGLVREAEEYFDAIGKDGMVPSSEHYACMVDVLARAGRLGEAYAFVEEMAVEATASVLGALFNGCMSHGNFELAEVVGRRLVEMDAGHDGRYIGLSNVYAVGRRWEEAESTRRVMESRGVRKLAGCSYVECLGRLHGFVAHHQGNPESRRIYFVLSVVGEHMKSG